LYRTLIPDRELVRSRFSEASTKYDKYAIHHRLIADEVVEIARTLTHQPESLLELGSGTGILSVKLCRCFPSAKKTFTDFAPGMVETCRGKLPESELITHMITDFENPKYLDSFELVVSSCAVQWASDYSCFVKNQSSSVRTGGFAVHAIPVSGMLAELTESFLRTGGRISQLNYQPGIEWNRLFEDTGFMNAGSFSKDYTVHYRSPAEAVRAIRSIGASLNGHPGALPVSPVSLRKALDFYRSEYGSETGTVPATYRIHFVVAEKVAE
jgi:malonyl-CoA O-methyltransferase